MFDIIFDSPLEACMTILASVSALFSFMVCLTMALFPSMRKGLFMQLITFISIADGIGSIGSAFGFPGRYDVICPIQSFLILFGYKTSWLWTIMLAHQLHNIFMYSKPGLKPLYMHAICWLVPLLTTLLPLSTSPFGRDDDANVGWCALKGPGMEATDWLLGTFITELFFSMMILIFFSVRIYLRYLSLDMNGSFPEVRELVDSLCLYPIGMVINWGPHLIVVLLYYCGALEIHSSDKFNYFNILTILATQNGTFSAFIFFFKSREARQHWLRLLSLKRNDGVRYTDALHAVFSDFGTSDATQSELTGKSAPQYSGVVGSDDGLEPFLTDRFGSDHYPLDECNHGRPEALSMISERSCSTSSAADFIVPPGSDASKGYSHPIPPDTEGGRY